MTGRIGRAAGVCAALGVLWWATVRLAWRGVGCDDWGCLAPTLGILVVITLALAAGSALALERVDVRPGRRVALVAAGVLVAIRVAGETLPSSAFPVPVTIALVFAAAGAVAAYVTGPGVARRWKVLIALGLIGLPPAALAVVWMWFGG